MSIFFYQCVHISINFTQFRAVVYFKFFAWRIHFIEYVMWILLQTDNAHLLQSYGNHMLRRAEGEENSHLITMKVNLLSFFYDY